MLVELCWSAVRADGRLGEPSLPGSKKPLLSFLLRNGYRYTGKAHWTQAHMHYLRELVLAHPTQKLIFPEFMIKIH